MVSMLLFLGRQHFISNPNTNVLLFPRLLHLTARRSFWVSTDPDKNSRFLDLSPPPPPQSVIREMCSLICQSYCQQQFHFRSSPPKLNLPIDIESLTSEQAITVVTSLVDESGPMVALSFFYWAIGFPKFKHFMRFYIVLATSLINHVNFERAHEVLNSMVKSFAEIGKLKEAVNMLYEMQNQGFEPRTKTLNCVIVAAVENGVIELAEKVFDEMCNRRGVFPDSYSFKLMVIAYCRMGKVLEADRWLTAMVKKGFLLDNATFTLVVSTFCDQNRVNRAMWFYGRLLEMGFVPNVINFTSLIHGLCKRGSVKQAFELLEEMVRKGWKPNSYTHTTLIDGLCKKGWTEKAFRLFLKLVRSEHHKPNVHAYTAMIGGYCKEEKMNRAEMLFEKMKEQGLVPNINTYTTLIDGHSKTGNIDRGYNLVSEMKTVGLVPNIYTYNSIADGLLKKGRMLEAYGLLNRAFEDGVQADIITYNILASQNPMHGDSYFGKIIKAGVKPDIHFYTTLTTAFCRQKRMNDSHRIFNDAIRIGLVPTEKTYTSIITGYCRNGDIEKALEFLNRMSDFGCIPDSFTYGSLISGLCKERKLDEAYRLYNTMREQGFSPCEVTRLTLAYEYCNNSQLSMAISVVDGLDKKLFIRTVKTLVRKLCCDKKVEMASVFLHKLIDVDEKVDRVVLAAFLTTCYDSNRYELVSDVSKRISKGIG
ncbi:pentatricopeptide repeat-containing protein At4g19890 [Impatiens glandulifera]|uniref:pentatricopeptide repeat-containing protein At4g19890 n=1 Tax=Impatiens glandulifera TaxID=253017 RepID=UPI001FB1872D|nr:pentatricopeptide repeat-containing protein At4g19890 [Impatiens glandulifera]